MLIQFKDIKAGDLIIRDGVLYKMNTPELYIFKNKPSVITVRAIFIERRTQVLGKFFNKRKNTNFEIKQGLCLQGFYSDKIDIIRAM